MREIRYMPIRALLLAALVPLAAAPPAAPATANSSQASLLQDDPQLIYTSSSHQASRLTELQSLGIDIVKVRVNWRSVAPNKRSPGFHGGDPAPYGDNWKPYDE